MKNNAARNVAVLCALAFGLAGPASARDEPAAAGANASAAAAASVPAAKVPPTVVGTVNALAPAPKTDPLVPPKVKVAATYAVERGSDCALEIARRLGYAPLNPPNPSTSPNTPASSKCKARVIAPAKAPAPGAKDERNTLYGAGDVVVVLDGKSYDAAVEHERITPQHLQVFFNGFNVTSDAARIATDRIGEHVFVRYYLQPGQQSRSMWAAMLRTEDMTTPLPLKVSYGWSETAPNSEILPNFIGDPLVAISTPTTRTLAIAIVLAVLVAATLFAAMTGVLRDPVPKEIAPLLPVAQELYARLRTAKGDVTALKQQFYSGFGTAGVDDAACDAATLAVLNDPAVLEKFGSGAVIVGLARRGNPAYSIPRAMSYSLGRVQLYSWFMFALLAGLFLKLVYSELPALDNSILTLLGISAGTAGLSWTIDKSSTQDAGTLSRGLPFDLVTGPGNEHQVHRFQSIMVNVALLAIGTLHIVTSIAYPTFDNSWLIFLGISGATFAAGKQLVEQPKP